MCFLLMIILYNLLVSTNEQNSEKFLHEEDCLNFKIIEILKSYFSSRQCLSLIFLSHDMHIPNEYFQFSNLPQIVLRKNESNYKPVMNMTLRPRRDFHTANGTITDYCEERMEGFILFAPNLKTLNSYTFRDMVTAFLNPRALFFIFVSEPIVPSDLDPFFVKHWRVYHAPHVGVTCCTCAQIFTASADRTDHVTTHDLDSGTDLLENKLYQVHGLPLRMCMFPSVMAKAVKENGKMEFEGVDRMMVDLLAEKMNFTKVIVQSPKNQTYGRRQPDGSFNGALGVLVTGNADMASVGFFAMDYQTRDVEPTQGVQVDDLCAVVHKAKEVPPWLAPVQYLGLEVCIALAMVYFGVAGVWIFIRRFEIPRKECDVTLKFLNTFRLMLTTSIPRLSGTTCERIFLAFCSVAFLTLAGTFQGSLVTVYSTQFFYKDIDSLADLTKAQLPVLTRFESFKNDIFTNESNAERAKLKDLVQIYTGETSINALVAEVGNVGGLTRRSSIDLDSSVLQYKDKKGISKLHLVRECIRTYNLAYMLPRASALSTRVNEIILRASQAGLFEKWYQDMAVNNTKYLSKNHHHHNQGRSEDANVPLSAEDLQLAMYALAAGMVVSLVAFVFEMAHVHMQLRWTQSSRRK